MFLFKHSPSMPRPEDALKGRSELIAVPARHFVNGASLTGPWPDGTRTAVFGLGCFWGAEKKFWQTPGVIATAAGYSSGYTPNPTYEEVCSGRTGHAETVLVAYDPSRVSYEQLLKVFWEDHDPTQDMRQGNDVGTQYRSVIYTHSPEQEQTAKDVIAEVAQASPSKVVTQLEPAPAYYRAETYHQEYFPHNPNQGYCAAIIGPKVAKFRRTWSEFRK